MAKNSRLLIDGKPFEIDIDEKSFYYFPALKQRLHILNNLFSGDSRLILVVGEPGSGKTLFLKQFLACNEKNWKKCKISANDTLDRKRSDAIENIREHPAYINSINDLPVIVMDDAERLNAGELLFLIKMIGVEGHTRRLKQLIFFCKPSMLQVMSSLEKQIPEERAIEKIYMPSLSQSETEEYIERKICSTGYTGTTPFSQVDINRIYEVSGGIPGGVNDCASDFLEKKFQEVGKVTSFFKKIF